MTYAPLTRRALMQAEHIIDRLDLIDPGHAETFANDLDDALRRIVENPRIGTPRGEWDFLGHALRSRRAGAYNVIYMDGHPRNVVIAIHHEREDAASRLAGLDLERELEAGLVGFA